MAKTSETKVNTSLQSVMLKPIAVPFAAKISIVSLTSLFMTHPKAKVELPLLDFLINLLLQLIDHLFQMH